MGSLQQQRLDCSMRCAPRRAPSLDARVQVRAVVEEERHHLQATAVSRDPQWMVVIVMDIRSRASGSSARHCRHLTVYRWKPESLVTAPCTRVQ